MKVDACLWYERPGEYAERRPYDSVSEVRRDLEYAVRTYDGAAPLADVYPVDSDECMMRFSVGPRGGVRVERFRA